MPHSREAILQEIRRHALPPTPLPTLDQSWQRFDDPIAQFAAVLSSVGGQCIRVGSVNEIDAQLDALPAFATAKVRCSLVPGVGRSTLDVQSISDPHQLESVDFAALPGELAVAENGAVWITDGGLSHRVLYFITQHLALVVPTHKIVHNLHEAYEQLQFSGGRFGAFISGPSKTADIEQSLVIGAHGPRSHIVFLVDTES